MSYSIPSSTKILNLTTAPFLFILVSALSVCKFAMMQGVYILLYCTSWKKRYTLTEGTDIYTHSAGQSSKHFKPLSVTRVLWQGQLEKNTNKEFNCVYGVCNLTKFEI